MNGHGRVLVATAVCAAVAPAASFIQPSALGFRHGACRANVLFIKPGSRCRRLSTQSHIDGVVNSVKKGERSVVDIVKGALYEIARRDPEIGAFLAVSGDSALAAAAQLDKRIASGDCSVKELPLLGLPVAVKDNICTLGVPTTAASRVQEGYVPSYDATAVARLVSHGAVVIGKTNMDEFGMGSTTESSGYKVTRNPRDTSRSPGGSSGGSAAAVAGEMVVAALGTDTGGSIRQPASWTGVVGLKPTYGRVSRQGLIAYGSSTDTIGPLTTTVKDAARVLAAIAGPDPRGDVTASTQEVEDYVGAVEKAQKAFEAGEKPLAGLRVGLIQETLKTRVEDAVASAVRAAVDKLSDLGAEVVEVSLPHLEQHCASYYVNVLSEASANLARYDGMRYGLRVKQPATAKAAMLESRGVGFGDEVKQRILLGTFSLSAGYSDAYYQKSQQLRAILSKSFADAFNAADVLVCPTAPTVAYPLGKFSDGNSGSNKVDMYADDLFTVPASLAGLPAVSVPTPVTEPGLPIGLQIIGRRFAEAQILAVAAAFELASKR